MLWAEYVGHSIPQARVVRFNWLYRRESSLLNLFILRLLLARHFQPAFARGRSWDWVRSGQFWRVREGRWGAKLASSLYWSKLAVCWVDLLKLQAYNFLSQYSMHPYWEGRPSPHPSPLDCADCPPHFLDLRRPCWVCLARLQLMKLRQTGKLYRFCGLKHILHCSVSVDGLKLE